VLLLVSADVLMRPAAVYLQCRTTAETSPKRTLDDAVATDTADPAAAAAAGEPAAKKTSP